MGKRIRCSHRWQREIPKKHATSCINMQNKKPRWGAVVEVYVDEGKATTRQRVRFSTKRA
jgi:hypothetical protein